MPVRLRRSGRRPDKTLGRMGELTTCPTSSRTLTFLLTKESPDETIDCSLSNINLRGCCDRLASHVLPNTSDMSFRFLIAFKTLLIMRASCEKTHRESRIKIYMYFNLALKTWA
jgi:hypothetical protein